MKVTKEMLSSYCKNIQEKFGIHIGQVAKLIPPLSDKKNYVLHYRNLQLYLSLGLKLNKGHRVLQFDQSPWLGQYINFNTQKWMNAKNAFEKDYFKLMNHSVYGSSIHIWGYQDSLFNWPFLGIFEGPWDFPGIWETGLNRFCAVWGIRFKPVLKCALINTEGSPVSSFSKCDDVPQLYYFLAKAL